jgi:methionyl-tRNA formyltransferase
LTPSFDGLNAAEEIDLRLVFAGTPAAAIPALRILASAHEVLAVVTRPDAPLGRKRVLTPSPVAVVAAELGVPILKATKLDEQLTAHIQALEPELGVIVAYGGIVREPLLSLPKHGWINLHFSILPRWRGAAPVQRALIEGDTQIGASVFQLVAALDAGDVFASRVVPVPEEATAGQVLVELAEAGAELTAQVVGDIELGVAIASPQVGEVTLAPKLVLEDGRLDFNEPGESLYARFRGVTPEPGAFTTVDGAALKLLEMRLGEVSEALTPGELRLDRSEVLIGTASRPLRVMRVQPAGRAAMAAGDWFRGQRQEIRVGS